VATSENDRLHIYSLCIFENDRALLKECLFGASQEVEVSLRDRGRAIEEAREQGKSAKRAFSSITHHRPSSSSKSKTNNIDSLVDTQLYEAVARWESAEKRAVDVTASYQAALSLWKQWEARFDMVAKWVVTDGAETVCEAVRGRRRLDGDVDEVGELIHKLEVSRYIHVGNFISSLLLYIKKVHFFRCPQKKTHSATLGP
jgi:hypothetical protein